jgi:hypothetical protein
MHPEADAMLVLPAQDSMHPVKEAHMATSSILGGERAAIQPSGRSSDLLGPSDSSDSGSDSIGELGPDQLASDTDRFGTGERPSADLRETGDGEDIMPDHIARASVGGASDSDPGIDELAVSEDDEDGIDSDRA